MKPYALLLFVLSLAPFLAGCPFESSVPLAAPSPESVEPRLVGTWIGIDEKDQDSVTVLILPFNRAEYYVETREKSGDTSRYRAYRFELGGQAWLHLNELGPAGEPESFFFARCTFERDQRVRIRFLGERIVPKTLSEDARGLSEFIAAHLTDPELDDPEVPLLLIRTN